MRGDYLALVTLAWGEIAYLFFINLDHPINITNGVNGIVGVDPADLFGHPLGYNLDIGPFTLSGVLQLFYLTLLFLGVVIWYAYRLKHSRLGRAWEAIREDEIAAVSLGVNRVRTKLLAFVLGASTAGMAGAVATLWQGSVFPDNFTLNQSILVLLIVVLGGMRIPGIVVSAAVLVIVPQLFQGFSLFRLVVWGILLIGLMILRPQGFATVGVKSPAVALPKSDRALPI
jgi:branched-chain amino acid transport system permease protein